MRAVAVAMGLALSACSSGQPASPAGSVSSSGQPASPAESVSSSGQPASPVSLEYRLWDSVQQVGYQKCVDAFEKVNPTIKVTISEVPWDSYWTKLTTEQAAGQGPDVFTDESSHFTELHAQNQVMDITQFVKDDNIDLSKYVQSTLAVYQDGAKTYGLPKDVGSDTLGLNLDIFHKLGVTVPTDLSWSPSGGLDTLLPLAMKLTVDTSGRNASQPGFDPNNVVTYGIGVSNNDQPIRSFFYSNGAYIIDKPGGTQWGFDTPKGKEALQYLSDLVNKYHVAPPGALTNPPKDGATELFQRGAVAMEVTGSWQVGDMHSKASFPISYIQMPAGPAGHVVPGGNGLADAISPTTKHPKEAWELMKYLASTDCGGAIMASGGYVLPGRSDSMSMFSDYWQKQGQDVTAFLDAANGKTVGTPNTNGFTQASIAYTQVLSQLFLGQITAQEAAVMATQKAAAAQAQATQ